MFRLQKQYVNTARANIPRLYRFYQFFVWFISFILDRKRSIVSKSEKASSPLPPTRYLKNSLHRRKNFITITPNPVFKKLFTPTIYANIKWKSQVVDW